jgi:prepilin-type N-terminal cleavage/methylation domain-containing protein
MIKKHFKLNRGFTIVELIISLAIFSMMTALLVAKYGTFNQGTLLTNLAYEVALVVRNAQYYGLNVKSAPVGGASFSNEFRIPYGAHFSVSSAPDVNNYNNPQNKQVVFYYDLSSSGNDQYIYDDISEKLAFNNIKRGSYINGICVGTGAEANPCATPVDTVDIVFQRPDPNARIYANGNNNNKHNYTEITIHSSTGETRRVVVRGTGEIEVKTY